MCDMFSSEILSYQDNLWLGLGLWKPVISAQNTCVQKIAFILVIVYGKDIL